MPLKLLITGGAGFAGSNLAIFWKQKYPESEVFAFDNLKRRGSELNLSRLKAHGVHFVHGDIRNREDFDALGPVDLVIDAAAEPSVLAGLTERPDYVINTNLNGTINCLNFAVERGAGFIFLSSSRVYPFERLDRAAFTELPTRFQWTDTQEQTGISSRGITTEFPTDGARSFYGATKLASELLIQEYVEFSGLRAVINRCGVLTGPWQMGKVDQGVVVLWMAHHFWNKKLSYNGYGGTGKQVRDILHIHDLFRLVDWQAHHLEEISGRTFNAGGGPEVSISLCELTAFCERLTGNRIEITPAPEPRKADVRLYITDNTEVSRVCGWQPLIGTEAILREIYEWILKYEKPLSEVLK